MPGPVRLLDGWRWGAIRDVVSSASSTATPPTPSSSALSDTMASVPSLRSLSKLAFGGAQVLFGGQTVLGSTPLSCSSPQLSCHNTTVVENLCCFNAPGGQLLQTQFWDTNPSTGPVDSWTIHGLWPDHCDGTFDANCDSSRAYKNISAIIQSFGATDLLNDMSTYWKDYQGDDETFWQHEWSKHGTCISTLEPKCYSNFKPTEEVVDFFQKTVDLFKSLPSYKWLAAAGITPSTTTTYTTAQIQAAISANRPGVSVTLGCKSGAINEIWYHYDVRGSVQSGEFVPANPDGSKSTCPSTGIRYLPKSGGGGGGGGTTTVPTTGTPAPTGTPFSGRGFLKVNVNGAGKGCIISAGKWYTSGTCATFTATASGNGFTLSSSKGNCGVVSGVLTCGGSVTTPTSFTNSGGKLAAGSNAAWSADSIASGTAQVSVYAGSDRSNSLEIVWSSS